MAKLMFELTKTAIIKLINKLWGGKKLWVSDTKILEKTQ